MLKKLLKLKKKNLIILIIISIVAIALISTATINIVKDIRERYAQQEESMTYIIHDVNKNVAQTTITFYDEDGLKTVVTPTNTINCNNRTTLYVDYNFTDRTDYEFEIIDQKGNSETINLFFEVPRAKGEYVLNNNEYVQEPYVDEGFEKGFTRYLYPDASGNLIPGNWINGEEPNNWYDYSQSKWANIYVESNGREIYYVWIPRYCYKIDETQEERMDVKFINVDNEYKFIENGEEQTWNWDNLQMRGYQIPHAFWWDKNENGQEDMGEQLAGYWMMKYPIANGTTLTNVNFDIAVRKGKISIKNITTNNMTNENPVTSFTVAINGNIVKTIENPDNIDYDQMNFTGVSEGNNYINVTALDASAKVIGSMTKKYEYSSNTIMNEPDLTGFNPETTFYVTWDAEGNEDSSIPITEDAPNNWYNYADGEWANIVTKNNDGTIYYVWIPRYQYIIDANERTTVKFIKGTSTEVQQGYTIPDAFWWDKNNNGVREEDEQLKGYWMMKYPASNI